MCGFAECQNDCSFFDYLSDNHSDSIQPFFLLEKLSKSDKSYIMSGKIYSKCKNLELTLFPALCQFIGGLYKGDDNDWYQENSEGLHFDFPKYNRMRDIRVILQYINQFAHT